MRLSVTNEVSAILVVVMSECCWCNVICKTWTGTFWTLSNSAVQRRCLIRDCTVCSNYRKLRIKWNNHMSSSRTHFLWLHSETMDPPVLSVLWLYQTLNQHAQLPLTACIEPFIITLPSIGIDKRGYQVNSFLISPWKHTLWVLIRSASPRCF